MSKPICVFQSPIWTRSGYGGWALSVAKSLLRYDKFELMVIPTPWGHCTKKHLLADLEAAAEDQEEKEAIKHILRQQLTAPPDVFIQMTIPSEFCAIPTPQGPQYQKMGKYGIGMTAGIETTAPRPDWLAGCNRMDLTFCLSNHVKNVLAAAKYSAQPQPNVPAQELKITTPLEVAFWGIDTSKFYKTDVIEPAVDLELSQIPEKFAFLFVGQWTHGGLFDDRKDIGNLIKTFCETFRGVKEQPCLVLKTSGAAICNMDRDDIIARILTIRRGCGENCPKVYLLHGDLSTKEMNSLYNHPKVKAFVTFTHGEGQGDPILQATLSGKPVLAPRWSGQLDYLNPKYSVLLEGEIKPVSPGSVNEWIIKESSWFYVDYKKAGEQMWDVFYNYDPYLEKAEKLRVENMTDYSEQAMDKIFHVLLDKYIPKFAVPQKLVLPTLKKLTPVLKKVELPKPSA
jgi:hypothetical protein